MTKIYLVQNDKSDTKIMDPHPLNVLTSYAYKGFGRLPLNHTDHLCDSGAFTFLSKGKAPEDLKTYVDKYADYVKRNRYKKYFEVDVDSIIGVKETRKLRDRLENRVGWQSIPVWHTCRSWDDWINDCRDYPYVAIGGFVTKEIPKKWHTVARRFTDAASEVGVRVHGLGFTPKTAREYLRYRFYSVDSSSWKAGFRYGQINVFCPREKKLKLVPTKKRAFDRHQAGEICLREWIKFSQCVEEVTSCTQLEKR